MNFNELYERYADEYAKDDPTEQKLFNEIAEEIASIIEDYGSLTGYADPDEPGLILGLYSIDEALFIQRKNPLLANGEI